MKVMHYMTVYTILAATPRIPWIPLVLGIFVLPTIIFALGRREAKGKLMPLIFVALLWNCIVIPISWTINVAHKDAQNLLRSGNSEVVEGRVQKFVPMPYMGHSVESFAVSNVNFKYSDFDDSKPGYNKTESHGGLIHRDMFIRLHYHDGNILQVEVPGEKVSASFENVAP